MHAYDMHEEELDKLWVKEPGNEKSASFGQNWGYQIGMERIYQYYVKSNNEEKKRDLESLAAADSSIEITPDNLGIGSMLMHTLTTPYVEVAGDGKTAQGLWYSPGQVTVAHPNKVDCMWMYEKYGVDFIRESDGWKIWHLFVGTDFAIKPGEFMRDIPVPDRAQDEKGWQAMSIEMQAYTPRHNWTLYPYIPQPYETFDPARGNGPEGNPAYGKGESK
jgi:hypothetical protein